MLPIQATNAGAVSTSLNLCMRYKRRILCPFAGSQTPSCTTVTILRYRHITAHGQAKLHMARQGLGSVTQMWAQSAADAYACESTSSQDTPKGLHRCTWVHKRIGAALEASSACSGALPAQLRTLLCNLGLHDQTPYKCLLSHSGVKPVDIYAFSCLCSSCLAFPVGLDSPATNTTAKSGSDRMPLQALLR